MQVENNPSSAMLSELKSAREEVKHTARTGEGGNPDGQAEELPEGSSPVEARQTSSVEDSTAPEETPAETSGEESGEPEETIRIGGRTFKTQAEAFAYAEEVERNRELTEAHSAGIREALEATRQPVQPDPEPEDDFEQRFYANPKEALKEVQAKATEDALRIIQQQNERESLWTQFLSEYPDVRRKDAERILNENMVTIGKMTDIKAGMKYLADKVRAEYDEITSLRTPRTVLANKKQVVSPAGSRPPSVTPKKNDERPLSFAEEMRRMKQSR